MLLENNNLYKPMFFMEDTDPFSFLSGAKEGKNKGLQFMTG